MTINITGVEKSETGEGRGGGRKGRREEEKARETDEGGGREGVRTTGEGRSGKEQWEGTNGWG